MGQRKNELLTVNVSHIDAITYIYESMQKRTD